MFTNKLNSFSSKTSSCRMTNSRGSSASKSCKLKSNPRRVIPSKKVPQNSNNRKTLSTGILTDTKKIIKPKKTTKSEFSVENEKRIPMDYCSNCGDVVANSLVVKRSSNTKSIRSVSASTKSDTKSINSSKKGVTAIEIDRKKAQPIKQYYKNENYQFTESTEDLTNGIKKISLNTIKETSEPHLSDSIFKIYPEDSEDITFFDIDDQYSLQKLKEFRQKNYFECHSAKSRVNNRGSAINLQGHNCVYRFYLNDRLFPVPLNSDHNNQVRCIECHLPMELNVDEAKKINGTIQAKVTIGKKNQDIMLLLPVKEPLIITEKRKEENPKDTEVVFFGVINLDGIGNSMFNSTLPADSLALKYQKGYQEFVSKEDYNYRDINKTDVIVI